MELHNPMINKDQVIEALKTVQDPELNMDVWTLGLVYEIQVKSANEVFLLITYTTPMCPFGPILNQKIQDAMHDLGFKTVEFEVTFDPPWEPSEELRASLGI